MCWQDNLLCQQFQTAVRNPAKHEPTKCQLKSVNPIIFPFWFFFKTFHNSYSTHKCFKFMFILYREVLWCLQRIIPYDREENMLLYLRVGTPKLRFEISYSLDINKMWLFALANFCFMQINKRYFTHQIMFKQDWKACNHRKLHPKLEMKAEIAYHISLT